MTEAIRRIDRQYAGATELDQRFTGFAKPHFVDLDFGDRLARTAKDARLVLFLQGSVEYDYSTTAFAAASARGPPRAEFLRRARTAAGWNYSTKRAFRPGSSTP